MGLTESNHSKNSLWGTTKSKNGCLEAAYEGKPRQSVTLPARPSTKGRESSRKSCVDDTVVSSALFRPSAFTNGQISYNSRKFGNYLPNTQHPKISETQYSVSESQAGRSPNDYYNYRRGEPFYISPSNCSFSEAASLQSVSTNHKGKKFTSRKSRSCSENCRNIDSTISKNEICEEISFKEKETQTFPEISIPQNLKKKKKKRSCSTKRSTSYKEYTSNPVRDLNELQVSPKKLSYSVPTTPSEIRSDPYICLYYNSFDDELPRPCIDSLCVGKQQILSDTSLCIPSDDKKKNKKSQIYIQLDDNFNKNYSKSEFSQNDPKHNSTFSSVSKSSSARKFNTHKNLEVAYNKEKYCNLCNKNSFCNFHKSSLYDGSSDRLPELPVGNLARGESHYGKLLNVSNPVTTRENIECHENQVQNNLLTHGYELDDKSNVLYDSNEIDHLKPQFLPNKLNVLETTLDLQNSYGIPQESLQCISTAEKVHKEHCSVPIFENSNENPNDIHVSTLENDYYPIPYSCDQHSSQDDNSYTFYSNFSLPHQENLNENKQHFPENRSPTNSPDKPECLSYYAQDDENQNKTMLKFDNEVRQMLGKDAKRTDPILLSTSENQVNYLPSGNNNNNNNNNSSSNRSFSNVSQQFKDFRIEDSVGVDASIDADFAVETSLLSVLETEAKSLTGNCSLSSKEAVRDYQCHPHLFYNTFRTAKHQANECDNIFKKSPFNTVGGESFHILRLPKSAEQPKLAEVLKKENLIDKNKLLKSFTDSNLSLCQMNKIFRKDNESKGDSMSNVKSFNITFNKDNSNTDSQTLLKKELKSERNLSKHAKDSNLFSSNMNRFPNNFSKCTSKSLPNRNLRRSDFLNIPKRFFSLPLKPSLGKPFAFDCNLTCHEQCQNVVSLDCKLKSPDQECRRPSSPSLFDEEDDHSNREDNVPLIKEQVSNDGEDDDEEEYFEEVAGEKYEEEILEKEILQENGGLITIDNKQEISTLRRTVRRIQSLTVDSTKIEEWVQKCPINNVGLQITKEEDGGYRGCLRIHLNLSRPINIVAGTRPPSIYDILQEDRTLEKTLTSFYMPRDTVKAIHITSKTTTREVIVALLRKFKVVDNPQKFALYERTYDAGQSMKAKLRRLGDNECPLVLAIAWSAEDITNKRLVLQENDTADIQWEAFSLPELDNFLRILEREEGEYKNQIRDKYSHLRQRLQWQLSRLSAMETC
ncbi:UNVERIFIED_CONTAM: hypothetical protein RMT77_010287 [Armadillidium vulgare]